MRNSVNVATYGLLYVHNPRSQSSDGDKDPGTSSADRETASSNSPEKKQKLDPETASSADVQKQTGNWLVYTSV